MVTNTNSAYCFIAFLFCISINGNIYSQFESSEKIQVFILAGQSNMDGRGDASKLTNDDVIGLSKAKENILFAYNGSQPAPLHVTQIKQDFIRKKFRVDSIFGPELFFGIEMSKQFPDKKFLFIKRSRGGTSLYGCWNPNWSIDKATHVNEQNKPKLFFEMLEFTDAILAEFDPKSYELAGMLWVQGESDSGRKLPSNSYEQNLTNLIQHTRKHYKTNDLPFLMLQVSRGKVADAMRSVSKNLPRVSFIAQSYSEDAFNFLPQYDYMWKGRPAGHYNYEGMKKIGVLFSKEFVKTYSK
ncbi:MAG: sialate O-acetylesterase [Flavobacteriaceae bacterium]|nr:sialate O-acetylesterase [Flavobacteriaceae bacterium]MDG2314054.1 sialate O-acetylesterase [Flavobacteriaceae bacterium]